MKPLQINSVRRRIPIASETVYLVWDPSQRWCGNNPLRRRQERRVVGRQSAARTICFVFRTGSSPINDSKQGERERLFNSQSPTLKCYTQTFSLRPASTVNSAIVNPSEPIGGEANCHIKRGTMSYANSIFLITQMYSLATDSFPHTGRFRRKIKVVII